MKRIPACLIATLISVLVFSPATLKCQMAYSAGFKLGYTWAEGGRSFNIGFELSAAHWDMQIPASIGLAMNYENIKHLGAGKLHFGVQSNYHLVGMEIGPSLLISDELEVGITSTTYAGILLIPYYEYSWFPKSSAHTAGAFLKYPIGLFRR